MVAELGLTVRELRLKFPRDTFFSRGEREVLLFASNFMSAWENHESQSEQSDWKLAFQLPRGAYATMIIRQLFFEGIELDEEDQNEGQIEGQEESHETF